MFSDHHAPMPMRLYVRRLYGLRCFYNTYNTMHARGEKEREGERERERRPEVHSATDWPSGLSSALSAWRRGKKGKSISALLPPRSSVRPSRVFRPPAAHTHREDFHKFSLSLSLLCVVTNDGCSVGLRSGDGCGTEKEKKREETAEIDFPGKKGTERTLLYNSGHLPPFPFYNIHRLTVSRHFPIRRGDVKL